MTGTTLDILIPYAVALAAQKIPYIWGGKNRYVGLDCSGLVQHLLQVSCVGVPELENAQGLFEHYSKTVSSAGPGPGALVFCGKSIQAITHVQMMLNLEQVIESGGGGSECTTPEIAFAKSAGVRIEPLSRRRDVVAIVGVTYPRVPR